MVYLKEKYILGGGGVNFCHSVPVPLQTNTLQSTAFQQYISSGKI